MTTFNYQNTRLALFCHIGTKNWRPVTATASGAVIKVAHQPFPVVEDQTEAGFAHAVIHKYQTQPESELTTPCIILFVGSEPFNGNGQTHAVQNGKVFFYMKDRHAYEHVGQWLSEFLKLTFEQAKRITGFKTRAEAHEFEAEFSHFLDIILPGRIESILAFRLLCEAKKFCGVQNEVGCYGVKIHAPVSLNDWLAPFAPAGADNAAKITAVARIMGADKEAEAKAVLEAVNAEAPNSEAVLKAVEAFIAPKVPANA